MSLPPNHVGGNQSLAGCRCPYCRAGKLQFRRVPNYAAVGIDGRPVTVPLAAVNVCPACGGEVVAEAEMRRWQTVAVPPTEPTCVAACDLDQ